MPRVSVVIPTYNRSDHIKAAISSVLNQSYRDLEIIVCDDASTDNTLEVIKTIQMTSNLRIRIEVLSFNLGPSAARNKAISVAEGELIAFLDSDDCWKPSKLEKQIAFLDKNPNHIGVGCNLEFVTEDDAFKHINFINPNLSPSNELFQLLYQCYISTPCFLVKKDALLLAGLFDLSLESSEDRDLWWRLPRLGRIGYLNEPLVQVLIHDTRISNTKCNVTEKTYIPVVQKTVWYWRNELSELEKRKIRSNAHLLVAYDAFQGNNFMSCIRNSITAILYGHHFVQSIKLIISTIIKKITLLAGASDVH